MLWARQLGIITVRAAFELAEANQDAMVLAESGAALAVLVTALMLHLRTQPYAYRYQNVAETVLASCSIAAVIACTAVYVSAEHLSEISISVFGFALVGMLVGPRPAQPSQWFQPQRVRTIRRPSAG